jgi:hypothetical protein
MGVMNTLIALALAAAFVGLAVWHFSMTLRPGSHRAGAVPSVQGKPLFVPSRASTVAVGFALLAFAGLVAATAGLVPTGIPPAVLQGCAYALALDLLLRAIGDSGTSGSSSACAAAGSPRSTPASIRPCACCSPLQRRGFAKHNAV